MITVEDLDRLAAARREFLARVTVLRSVAAAADLRAWAARVNAELNRVAEALGDGPALNTEAITTWVQFFGR